MAGALAVFFPAPPSVKTPVYRHDHPYGVSEITPTGRHLRKYPTGDWMTSPQVYEEVQDPFTALSFVDMSGGEQGLQIIHDGSQALFFAERGVWTVLSMNDPWDEDYFVRRLSCRFRLHPHRLSSSSALWKRAQEFRRGVEARKQSRHLDDYRGVWATAHLVDNE